MADDAFVIPAREATAETRRKLERLAPELRSLCAEKGSVLSEALFAGLECPRLEKLTLLPGCRFDHAQETLASFTRLESLRLWTSTHEESMAAVDLLAEMPWSTRLVQLDLWFFSPFSGLEASSSWTEQWAEREFALEWLRISGAGLEAVGTVLRGHFPRLRYLEVSSALPDELLPRILNSRLPCLETLDLRFNSMSGEALQVFANQARERLPELREVGIEMYTGDRVEHHDWNGAIVERYELMVSNEEIERKYLQGTGLKVATNFPSW